MEEIKSFLAGKGNIECAVVLTGSENSFEMADYLEKVMGIFKVFTVRVHDKTEEKELKQEICTGCDILLFDDDVPEDTISRYSYLKPICLVGAADSEKVNVESIWKQYRYVSDEIYICVGRTGKKREIMHWNRNEADVDLSVILPVYNVEKYLSQCLDSLLAWDAGYVEYIFVIDGSPDNSEAILRQYQAKDDRIKIICKENGGCASARNRGLDEAKGTYVGFVDPDDFVDNMMFDKLLMRALCGGYDYAYCGYQLHMEDSGMCKPVMADALNQVYIDGTVDCQAIFRYIVKSKVAIWRGIYKNSILQKNAVRFNENINRHDDLPFKVEVLFAVRSVVCVPEYLYYYRIGREGQDVACTDDRLFIHFCIFDYLDRKIVTTRNQQKIDCLQIIKTNTHKFIHKQIAPQWRKEYAKRAKDDLHKNMGFWRTMILMFRNRMA